MSAKKRNQIKIFFKKKFLSRFGVSAGKRDQIEIFFKKKFLSKIDVDLIIWSRTFIISKKIILSIWSLFPALTPYSEQNTGTWWQNTEKSLPCSSKLLSIMLYSDATNVDTLEKKTSIIIFICQ